MTRARIFDICRTESFDSFDSWICVIRPPIRLIILWSSTYTPRPQLALSRIPPHAYLVAAEIIAPNLLRFCIACLEFVLLFHLGSCDDEASNPSSRNSVRSSRVLTNVFSFYRRFLLFEKNRSGGININRKTAYRHVHFLFFFTFVFQISKTC